LDNPAFDDTSNLTDLTLTDKHAHARIKETPSLFDAWGEKTDFEADRTRLTPRTMFAKPANRKRFYDFS